MQARDTRRQSGGRARLPCGSRTLWDGHPRHAGATSSPSASHNCAAVRLCPAPSWNNRTRGAQSPPARQAGDLGPGGGGRWRRVYCRVDHSKHAERKRSARVGRLLAYSFFLFWPSSKCLVRLMTSCFFSLQFLHSRRSVIFLVVFACRAKRRTARTRTPAVSRRARGAWRGRTGAGVPSCGTRASSDRRSPAACGRNGACLRRRGRPDEVSRNGSTFARGRHCTHPARRRTPCRPCTASPCAGHACGTPCSCSTSCAPSARSPAGRGAQGA